MTIEMQREALKGVYHSRKWWLKVRKMTDAQVAAIFARLKQQAKV